MGRRQAEEDRVKYAVTSRNNTKVNSSETLLANSKETDFWVHKSSAYC